MTRACNIGRDDRNKGEAGAPTARPRESAPPSPCVEGGGGGGGGGGMPAQRPRDPTVRNRQEGRNPAPPPRPALPRAHPASSSALCRPSGASGHAGPWRAPPRRGQRLRAAGDGGRRRQSQRRLPKHGCRPLNGPARMSPRGGGSSGKRARTASQWRAGGPTPARHQRWCWRRHAVPAHSLVDKSLRL